MRIYYLYWTGTGRAPRGGAAYTDSARAERHAEHANKHKHWTSRLFGHRWAVSTLNLKEGPKDV